MRHKRFYTLIGLFTSISLLIASLGGVLFYREYLKSHIYTYVMFFPETLRGVDISSSVMFRGVKIGQVRAIEITENEERNNVVIPVYVEFFIEKHFSFTNNPVRLLVRKGFVAEIARPNFLTGIADIVLLPTGEDMKTPPKNYRGYPVFPTRYSKNRVLTFENMIHSATEMFDHLNQFIDSKNVKNTLTAAKEMFDSLGSFFHSKKLSHTMDSATNMADSLKEMGHHVEKLTDDIDDYFPLMSMNLVQGMQKMGEAAEALHMLSVYLIKHPQSLFWGKR